MNPVTPKPTVHAASQVTDRLFGIETWYQFIDIGESESKETPQSCDQREHAIEKPDARTRSVKIPIVNLIKQLPIHQCSMRKSSESQQYFLDDGTAIHFDVDDDQMWTGFLKTSTAEISEILQLKESLGHVEATVRRLSNNTTAKLHPFQGGRDLLPFKNGCHENYQTEVASGTTLILYRLMIRFIWVYSLLARFITAACVIFLSVYGWIFGQNHESVDRNHAADTFQRNPPRIRRFVLLIVRLTHTPTVWLIQLTGKHLAFRKQRRYLTAFLVSRLTLFGVGDLSNDGRFYLSRSARFTTSAASAGISTGLSPVFLYSHWVKAFCQEAFYGHVSLEKLLDTRQRMQIALSDANKHNQTSCLKVAITCLVLEMIQAGHTQSLPVLNNPVRTIDEVNSDWYLVKKHATNLGKLSALDLQMAYWNSASDFVGELADPRKTNHLQTLLEWRKMIDGAREFENDGISTDSAIGKIDWLTKRSLIDSHPPCDEILVRQSVANDYHRLSGKPLEFKREKSIADQTENRVDEPDTRKPIPKSQKQRIAFIKKYNSSDQEIEVTWNRAVIRSKPKPQNITFG